jgi:hypothetical protein
MNNWLKSKYQKLSSNGDESATKSPNKTSSFFSIGSSSPQNPQTIEKESNMALLYRFIPSQV